MFFMVTASFFFVCGVSAAQHDVYAGFSVPSTFTFTDTVTYDVSNRSYGTAAYIDITWTWANNHNFYNNKGASISVAGADYYGQIELMSVSASDPTIDCSLDGNRIRIYFNSDYNGSLSITLTYACNYTWYVGSITGIPAPADSLQDVTMRTNFTLSFGKMNYYDSASIGMGDLDAKLNQILVSLGVSTGSSKFLGDDAIFYLNDSYFQGVNRSSGTCDFNNNGVCEFTSPATSTPYRVHFFGGDGSASGAQSTVGLQSGDYIFYYSAPVEVSDIIFYSWQDNYSITDHVDKIRNNSHVGYFVIHVSAPISSVQFTLVFNDSFTGVIYGGLARMDINQSAQDAINPDQSGLVDDVDNAGQQQAQQEEKLWTNINSYKGDLTFNLDDWSEAAGGLSYVSGIFMSIWNNSPTQIIILSLMLGIAMLSIGRGVQTALSVSRNRDDD